MMPAEDALQPALPVQNTEPVDDSLPTEVQWMDWRNAATAAPPSPPVASGASPELPEGVLPLGGVPQQQKPGWADVERGPYWRRILTGEPDTVPEDIRKAAGADAPEAAPEENEYRLLNTVNRSWAVDHLGMSREQVSADWQQVRGELAEQMGVRSDERELFTALSLREQEAPLREQARRAYTDAYMQALENPEPEEAEPLPSDSGVAEPAGLEEIRRMARERAREDREACLPHLDEMVDLVQMFSDLEQGGVGQLKVVMSAPRLIQSLDKLADMDARQRGILYRLLGAELKRQGVQPPVEGVMEAAFHNFLRGGVNNGLSVVQGIGNLAVSQMDALAESLGSDTLRNISEQQDRRLRMLEELRRVVQNEILPVKLEEDCGFAEEVFVDACSAIPGAAMAFCGPIGLSVLAVSGAGASVADARQRAPEGDRRYQFAAGFLAGGAQACLFRGMSALGQRLFGRVLGQFASSVGKGRGGYMRAFAEAARWFTQENVKLLLAGKAAQVTEMGLQELAARASGTASHIDWKSYGDNLLDLELNIREAAANLPFVLMAAGRASLRYFRSPRAILGDGSILEEWGVPKSTIERIMNAPDLKTQELLLVEGLRSGTRWSGATPQSEGGLFSRCLRLLNMDDSALFSDEQNVRKFLNLPPESSRPASEGAVKREPAALPAPEQLDALHAHLARRKPVESQRYLDSVRLMYEWYSKSGLAANGDPRKTQSMGELVRYLKMPMGEHRILPRKLLKDKVYSPELEQLRESVFADTVKELERLSYRVLLNANSLEYFLHSGWKVEQINKKQELLRKKIYRLVANEVLRSVMTRGFNHLRDRIADFFGQYYVSKKRLAVREKWVKETPTHVFSSMSSPNLLTASRLNALPPEVTEQLLINNGIERVVKTLNKLLPHTENFLSLMSQGLSPRQCYEQMLRQELGDDMLGEPDAWLPKGWNPLLKILQENDINAYAVRNAERFALYRQLSGWEPERDVALDGSVRWRIRRGDGRPMRWHDSRTGLMNELTQMYTLGSILPKSGELYADMMRSYSMLEGSYLKQFMQASPSAFSVDDALGIQAMNDLLSQWMKDASVMPLGLETLPPGKSVQVRRRYDGLEGVTYQLPGADAHHYVFDRARNATPLNLIMARARVYWRRMLRSGWVSAEDAAGFLQPLGIVSQEEAQSLLHPQSLKERAAAIEAWSGHLAHASSLMYIAEMRKLGAPLTVQEWVLSLPFRRIPSRSFPLDLSKVRPDAHPSRAGNRKLIHWFNTRAAKYLTEQAPRVAKLREFLADESNPLHQSRVFELYRELWNPCEVQRKEQSWSYLLSGDGALRNMDQRYWNILRYTEEGWNRLPAADKEEIRAYFEDVCREHPAPDAAGAERTSIEACLRNLRETLEQYPGLRDYAVNPRQADSLLKLEPGGETSSVPDMRAAADTGRINPGGSLHEAELPPEMAADKRVMPALHLLTALRQCGTVYPLVTNGEIWWRKQRYGGADGLRPAGVGQDWILERPLGGILRFFEKLATQYAGKPVNVGGVRLEPLRDIADFHWLDNITVYRHPAYPGVQVRLMPGDGQSSMGVLRSPYVVQSLVGVPQVNRSQWNPDSDAEPFYRELVRFSADPRHPTTDEHLYKRKVFANSVRDTLVERLSSPEALEAGRQASMTNRELIMHMAQDSNFSALLEDMGPGELVVGEALVLKIIRDLMAYEYGNRPRTAEAKLMKIGELLRSDSRIPNIISRTLLETAENYEEVSEFNRREKNGENRKNYRK